MLSINQRLKCLNINEVKYEDMNINLRSHVIAEFGKWWNSVTGQKGL